MLGQTAAVTECFYFAKPALLRSTAAFLAMNQGKGQKTQSVWEQDGMVICEHDREFWSGTTTVSVVRCEPFASPRQIPKYRLVSINSGAGIVPQSLWQSAKGLIAICDHEKDSGWLGLGYGSFGKVLECREFSVPLEMFPLGANKPQLAGMTSDSSRPWETYWQDKNGLVYRCSHEQAGFWSGTLGKALECRFWIAPRPST